MNIADVTFWLAGAGLAVALLALGMTWWNLAQYRRPGRDVGASAGARTGAQRGEPVGTLPLVSVCVPARNEEANLRACVEAVLASVDGEGKPYPVEVLVYDDQSTDRTPAILQELCGRDARVRAVPSVPLPDGWNGKQHACWRMSKEASGEWMIFTDADVRFAPGAVWDAVRAGMAPAGAAPMGLVSTFPRQVTGTLAEKLVVPMIFFILFSYLPFVRMRGTTDPAASAGCGQFLCVRRDAYEASGGHQGFKESMHDGIRMPRAVRRAGFSTDLFDGTQSVSCRMYSDLRTVWRGFAKNAYEGLGSVGLLVFLTVMHAVGHVLPWIFLSQGLAELLGVPLAHGLVAGPATALAAGAVGANLVQRSLLASRLRHDWAGVWLHPVAVTLMTLIQWHSYVLTLRGARSWKGRVQGAGA